MSYRLIVLAGVIIFAGSLILSRIASLLMIRARRKRPIDISRYLGPGDNVPLGAKTHAVRFCSEKRFSKLYRLLPWEAIGVLIISDSKFRFRGKSLSGEPLSFDFSKDESLVTYVKGEFIRDGGLSWFVIEFDGQNHYFTSDTSIDTIDSSVTTTGVFEAVSDVYINQ